LLAGRQRLQRRDSGIDFIGINPEMAFAQAAFFVFFSRRVFMVTPDKSKGRNFRRALALGKTVDA